MIEFKCTGVCWTDIYSIPSIDDILHFNITKDTNDGTNLSFYVLLKGREEYTEVDEEDYYRLLDLFVESEKFKTKKYGFRMVDILNKNEE